jgi:hypothetical protein
VVNEHLAARRQCARADVAQLDVEDVRAGEPARVREQIAACELLDGDAAEVERGAMTRARPLNRLAVDLDAAHTRCELRRHDDEVVADRDLAAEHRAGDDRAESLHGEHPVDRHAERPGRLARRDRVDRARELAAQLVEARLGAEHV